jgi:HSP20 family molecular chaperone IbpA
MLKKHHASSEKLREVFHEKDCVLETAIDKISKFQGDVIEKTGEFIPRIDLFETEDTYHIDIELPGLAADEINVTVTGEWIRVAGKRSKRTDNR